MINKRLWIAPLAIPICLISIILVGAQRSRQAEAGGVIDPTCTSSSPCIEYDNTSSGPGVRGVSVSGNGLNGQTKFKSTAATNATAGVLGNDLSTSGAFDAGVRGLSVRGAGVAGQSTSGSGVSGISTSGSGVTAISTSGEGLNAISTKLDGVVGRTLNPSKTSGIGVAGVDGLDSSSDGGHLNAGVLGTSINGFGVFAVSSNYVGANVVGGANTGGIFLPALSIVATNTGSFGNELIDGCSPGSANPCDAAHSVFSVDGSGSVSAVNVNAFDFIQSSGSFNIVGGGQYLKNNVCAAGCTAATAVAAGRGVTTYTSMVSQPTIEDFGEAQLVNGQAYVRLDPKFANVVDQRANYLVFITPEGDANVLYVTQKSLRAFTVRESHGGRSTLMFSYRIVAKPFGSHEARLPMVELPKLHSGLRVQARRFHSQP